MGRAGHGLNLYPTPQMVRICWGSAGSFSMASRDAVDVDGDGGCIAEGFHAPDAVVDGLPAENDIRVNHKEFKQLEFFVGKQFVFSPDSDDAGGRV